MVDYKEKERIYNTDFELVINDLKNELLEVLANSDNPHILKLKNHIILKEESFVPVLRQIHLKWMREFEEDKTLIEEVYLCLITDGSGNYVWKPSMQTIKDEQILFCHNFTQDITI